MTRLNKALRQIAPGFLTMLLIFSLLRLVFHIYNADLLALPTGIGGIMKAYFWGFRYDLAVLFPAILPCLLLLLINSLWLKKDWLAGLARWLLWLTGIVLIVISVADIPYFRFNSRRATSEVFDVIKDSSSAFSSFLVQYLLFVLLTFVLMVVLGKAIGINRRYKDTRSWLPISLLIVVFVLAGNFGRTLTPKNISFHVRPEYNALVSNTPMSLGYSILKGQEALEPKRYFSSKMELEKQFDIHYALEADTIMEKRSVVIFVLESFSNEYLVPGHRNKAPTPFLDSLMKKSIVFTNAYANGTTSAYGLMSILGGIPPFMDEPYFSSIYGQNRIRGIGSLMRDAGYSTSFFYGAEDDHYGFRKNMTLLGIDQYHSMEDYPGDDFDGHWGIYDEPFFDYVAAELKSGSDPVFATIFNISTHFPYMVPMEYQSVLPKGNLPSHQSIAYTDLALQGFFNQIQTDPDLSSGIFVFVADHWAKMREMEDKSAVGIYRIPMFIYDPLQPTGSQAHHIAQQVDVVPTILDMLNYSGPWTSFGSSALDEKDYRFTYNEFENIYRIIDSTYVLAYDENREVSFSLHNHQTDPELKENIIDRKPELVIQLEARLKAVIQTYNNSLVNNSLMPHE